MRASSFALVAVALVLVVAVMLRAGIAQHGSFKAFYCGAYAVREGANPYLVEPLRSCEHTVAPQALPARAVEPAPLPGYALAAFVPLTILPFGAAAALFALLSLAAALAAALVLSRLTAISAATIAIVTAPLVLLNIAFGEIPVLTMCAVTCAGYALSRKRYVLTAAFTAAAMLQPQVGIAAAFALAVLAPRVRVPLLVSFAVLAIVCLAAAGPAVSLAYVQSVLPAQAASELNAADQYGIAHQLYLLGAAPALALQLAGFISAAVMLLGIAAAALAARRLRAPELIVFLPCAAMLLGGIYAHDLQVIIALPAAFAVVARIAEPRRVLAIAALLALAIVWTESPGRAVLFIDFSAIAAACAACIEGTFVAKTSAAVLCAAAFAAGILWMHAGDRALTDPGEMAAITPTELASNAWRAYLDATPARTQNTPQHTGQKFPAWAGIALLVAVSVRRT